MNVYVVCLFILPACVLTSDCVLNDHSDYYKPLLHTTL